jgi:hypothetical protein
MIALVQRGSIRADTMVWQEGTPAWTPANATGLAAYLPAPTPQPLVPPPVAIPAPVPPPMNMPTAVPAPSYAPQPGYAQPAFAPGQTTVQNFVYPANPPKSPSNCWWSLLWLGIPHFIFGQTGKGALWAGIELLLWIFLPIGIILCVPAVVIATIDAHKVGKALMRRPVGKWEWFPS